MTKQLHAMGLLVCILTLMLCQCGQNGSKDKDVTDDLETDTGDSIDSDTDKSIDSDTEQATETQPEPNWISLSFVLEKDSTAAGTPVSYTATLNGDDGSTRTAEVNIESDRESPLTFDAASVTATLAEIHKLTATWTKDGQSLAASATLSVGPGEPASIELKLLPTEPEIDTPLFVLALIKDAYGNVCDDPWTLQATAEPGFDASSVLIDGENLIFTKDGWYTLVATVETNGLTGSLGPLVVDSYGPELLVTHPERGTSTGEMSGKVEGKTTDDLSGIGEVTINGESAEFDEEGNFSHSLDYEFGLNAVQTLATDGDGNVTTDRRSVLAGTFLPKGSGIGNGIQARINQDTIDIIEGAGEDLVMGANLNDFIPDPVYYKKSETCSFLGCIKWYELQLNLDDVRIKDIQLTLDPQANGSIVATATIYNVIADWSSRVMVAGVAMHPNGSISADTITIRMSLRASVSGSQVKTAVSDVSVSSTGFKFDFDSWIYDAAKFFGINVDNLVRGYVEGAIKDTVQKEVPKALEDALVDLTLGLDFDFLGATYDIQAKPYDIDVDDLGLTLGLETFMAPRKWVLPYSGNGILYAGYHPPTYGGTPGIALGFSGDFINQALYAFWGGGLLRRSIALGQFEMPIDLPYLPATLDNFNIVIEALLPPIVVPGTDEHLLDLQAGDIKIELYSDDPSDPDNLFAVIYVGFDAELDLTISAQNTLAPRIDDVVVWFDLVYPIAPNGWEINLETLAETLVDEVIPFIHDAIGSIPVPSLYDLTISSLEVKKDGPEKGYVTAGGQLEVL